ncbi:hypothetical protein [Streptomyces griseorubiginosus]|uniref:hypothetical protein n=1 Tax=Streptomyces griseorubiginosus TaxID=67304 RepID=UPI0033DC5D50
MASVNAEALTYKGGSCGPGSGNDNHPCLVLYYNSNFGGASAHFYGYYGISNLAGINFPSNGSGGGTPVKNNAASAAFWNWLGGETAFIYYNSNYAGPCDALREDESEQGIGASRLAATYNNNASIQVLPTLAYGDCVAWD